MQIQILEPIIRSYDLYVFSMKFQNIFGQTDKKALEFLG